jgi:type III restriction enzyme
MNGQQRNYTPDFVTRVRAAGVEWNLILEVTGERHPDKEAKTATARTLWVPAVNNHGGFGRWAFYETRDPWNVKTELREFLNTLQA